MSASYTLPKCTQAYSCGLCVAQLTERECQLDGALLRCGRLREGLESFADWLTDVELRQSQQKPFSIDHKALKPQQQIQEVTVMLIFASTLSALVLLVLLQQIY